jgi:hypothetical protein
MCSSNPSVQRVAMALRASDCLSVGSDGRQRTLERYVGTLRPQAVDVNRVRRVHAVEAVSAPGSSCSFIADPWSNLIEFAEVAG